MTKTCSELIKKQYKYIKNIKIGPKTAKIDQNRHHCQMQVNRTSSLSKQNFGGKVSAKAEI